MHGACDCVPLVVEGAIPDMCDFVSGQLEDLGNVGSHLVDGALLLGAYVVDLSHLAPVQDHIEGLSHVLHIQVAAHQHTH